MIQSARSSVQSFCMATSMFQGVPILTAAIATKALQGAGNDASLARRNLVGLYQKTPPHELGLPNDDAITGKIGGLALKHAQNLYGANANLAHATVACRIRLIAPFTRNIRPANARGVTSFHLSFETIRKNHIQYRLPTKSGRQARPDEHGKYVEDIDKFEVEPGESAVDPDSFAHYQEREQALAISEAECVYTNIEGDRDHRVEFFRKVGLLEESNRPPSLTIDVGVPSRVIQKFLKRAAQDEELAEAINAKIWERIATIQNPEAIDAPPEWNTRVRFEGEMAVKAHTVLYKLGWRKKMQRPGTPDSNSVRWDEGKSGRIQMRVVGEIPHELGREGRKDFMRSLSGRFEKLGVPYVLVMHRPTAENHEKNWHYHLIYYDRPAERFDPQKVRERLTSGPDGFGRYGKRYHRFLEAALQDPNVLAQTGKYDFEVEYSYIDNKNRRQTVTPFKQNKNRECTRTNFVPDLRKFVAEISNRELERAKARRRGECEEFGEARYSQGTGRETV